MRVTITFQHDDIYGGYEMARPIQERPEGIEFFNFSTIKEARQYADRMYEQTGWRRIAPGVYNCEASVVTP